MRQVANDENYSPAVRERVEEMQSGLEGLVGSFRADDDEPAALAAGAIGTIFVAGVAAVCSAVEDLAAAIRDRPS